MAVGRNGGINPDYDIIEVYARFYEIAQYGHDSGERPITHEKFLEFLRNFQRLIRLVNAKAEEAKEKEEERAGREKERGRERAATSVAFTSSAKKRVRTPGRQLSWDAADLD